MTADMIGTWDGTLVTDDSFYIPPKTLSALRFSIEIQSEDETLRDTERSVANIRGHIRLGGWRPDGTVGFYEGSPATGFVDDGGEFTLTAYGGAVYAGHLTRPRVGFGIISGKVGEAAFDP